MWFKKDKSFKHEKLGMMQPFDHQWLFDFEHQLLGELYCGLPKEGSEPDEELISHFIEMQEMLPELFEIAREYVESQDIQSFISCGGEFSPCSVFISGENEFDLEFCFPEWDDGYILVHFVGGKPENLSYGD